MLDLMVNATPQECVWLRAEEHWRDLWRGSCQTSGVTKAERLDTLYLGVQRKILVTTKRKFLWAKLQNFVTKDPGGYQMEAPMG